MIMPQMVQSEAFFKHLNVLYTSLFKIGYSDISHLSVRFKHVLFSDHYLTLQCMQGVSNIYILR